MSAKMSRCPESAPSSARRAASCVSRRPARHARRSSTKNITCTHPLLILERIGHPAARGEHTQAAAGCRMGPRPRALGERSAPRCALARAQHPRSDCLHHGTPGPLGVQKGAAPLSAETGIDGQQEKAFCFDSLLAPSLVRRTRRGLLRREIGHPQWRMTRVGRSTPNSTAKMRGFRPSRCLSFRRRPCRRAAPQQAQRANGPIGTQRKRFFARHGKK